MSTSPAGFDPALPVAARVQLHRDRYDDTLTMLARVRRPRVLWWWGAGRVEGRWGAICYLCDQLIDTWARRYPITERAKTSIDTHRSAHVRALPAQLIVSTALGGGAASEGDTP